MSKYISIENEQKINELLSDENSELIMKFMINKYTNESIQNAQIMLSYINDVVSNMMKISATKIQDLNQASWMLLFQTQMDEDDIHSYFATMVPVVKTLFPNGYPENGNVAQKEYFNKFIKLCKNKKAFNWNKETDILWAKSYNYYEYLDMIFTKFVNK